MNKAWLLLAALSQAFPQHGGHGQEHGAVPRPGLSTWELPNGSGTSWIPSVAPMHAHHLRLPEWTWMLHGSAYFRYTAQNANHPEERGEDALDGPNWFMAMGEWNASPRDRMGLRAMVSLDPFTEGGDGYPLLFQVGETFEDRPLIDRQHPHDLFMELAAIYARALDSRGRNLLLIYLGYPGEPALGPPVYMHRPSANILPDAVLGHHNQDATHIVFGVATLGLVMGDFKLDGSIFTGREPDEERLNFDRPRFDSYGLRLAYRFAPSLTGQVSGGFINAPEALSPEEDLVRLTASAVYARPLAAGNHLAGAFVYGGNVNLGSDHEDLENSFLFEAEWEHSRFIPYGRYEILQREAGELELAEREGSFWIQALTLGSGVRIWREWGLELLAGAQGTVNAIPEEFEPEYGSYPLSYEIFLKLRPGRMETADHGTHRSPYGGMQR